jgi:type IV fimbrial biogenesis protein FimT
LGRSATLTTTHRRRNRGFSMVELAVSLTVMLVLTAIAIPSLMRSFRTYQLNDAAGRVSDLLKFTRFEAVRRNTTIKFLMVQPSPPAWIVGTDSNGNGLLDPAEKQYVISGFPALLAAGAPNSAAITATLNGATLTTLSGTVGSVTFDARGAIRVGGAVTSSVFVFYVGNLTNPEYGFRAVILLPSGAVQIWTAPNGGTWQRVG